MIRPGAAIEAESAFGCQVKCSPLPATRSWFISLSVNIVQMTPGAGAMRLRQLSA